MVAWAASGRFPKAGFLCICVDPNAAGTAQEFGQLYFAAAPVSLVNGFIDSRNDFPNFQAQLGCQGFVIFNSKHQIVVPSSAAFTQYREGAFRDVEGKLSHLLQPAAPENPMNAPVGQQVRIVNLSSAAGAALNGQIGEVVGSTDAGRYQVKLGESTKALNPANLEDATGAPVGKMVMVFGLTSEKGSKMNGQEGEVLGGMANGRYIVKLSGATMALRKENLKDTAEEDIDASILHSVVSVGHSDMDAQHDTCKDALTELYENLSVKALKRTRDELKLHFDDEERLLAESGFGGGAGNDCCKETSNDFGAMKGHVYDHQRIIALVDDAIAKLSNVCDTSDSYGGTVPKSVAATVCKAFVEHAKLYDALYEGKLVQAQKTSEVEEMDQVD